MKVDKPKIQQAVKMILEAIGENTEREGLKNTPARVADMYEEIFQGIGEDPTDKVKVYKLERQQEMILVKDIPFYSVCEHHILPFFGKAHIAYIPEEDKITGFSNIVRVVETFSKRPQLQERLTTEIADALVKILKPQGVLVVIKAEHLCITMRGINKPGSQTITSAVRGVMKKEATRLEALSLINEK
jgi:GTP cyclohydrolase I